MKILVVEDDFVMAQAIGVAVRGAGHALVGVAATSSKALALARSNVPDLALLNIHLGDGSLGTDLARVLFAQFAVPSMFVSGSAREARTAADVVLGFISKPWDPRTIVASIAVAGAIIAGRLPPSSDIPPGLELFRNSLPSRDDV